MKPSGHGRGATIDLGEPTADGTPASSPQTRPNSGALPRPPAGRHRNISHFSSRSAASDATSSGIAKAHATRGLPYPPASRLYIMTTRRIVQYSPRPSEDSDGSNVPEAHDPDLRFMYTPKSRRKIPSKSIMLALFLLLMGLSLLSLSYFIFSNHMEGDGSQANGLLFLSILAFLPGYYETRIAYYSWTGAPGYFSASIPDY